MPSTPIQQVRSIIQDKPVHVSGEVIPFDGTITTYTAKSFPIDATSIITTPNTPPDSVNAETGLMVWNAAPGAQGVAVEYDRLILSDQSIQDLIDIIMDQNGDGTYDIRLVAAGALDAMASNQAIIQKVITSLDLHTNGAALAKALRDHATTLREQVFNPDYQESTFDWAEQINDTPGYREKIRKDWMRVDF